MNSSMFSMFSIQSLSPFSFVQIPTLHEELFKRKGNSNLLPLPSFFIPLYFEWIPDGKGLKQPLTWYILSVLTIIPLAPTLKTMLMKLKGNKNSSS